MAEQYTNSAKTVIREARKAAQSFGHTYIGSEHLLLGLLREKEGTASRLLREYQVEEEKVAGLIDTLITPVSSQTRVKGTEYSPRAKSIINNAGAEAKALGLDEVGTEHILLALVEDVESVGARILHTLEVDLQKLYRTLLEPRPDEKCPHSGG